MPGRLGNGEFHTRGYLVVLADDAGHRAVPVWLRGEPGEGYLSQLVELASRPGGEIIVADAPEELTARLLHAADASVASVDIDVTVADIIDELNPQVTVARVGLHGSTGTRQVTAGLGLGLAMAVASGAPVRVSDAVMDRLAVPVVGEDLLAPFLDHVPPYARALHGHGLAGWPMGARPGKRPRFEPRNLDFADGLDRWDLDKSPCLATAPSQQEDYAAAADGQSAVLSSAVARPAGSAALIQTIFADDYRGATVVFRSEIRTDFLTGRAGLRVVVLRHWWRTGRASEDYDVTVLGGSAWTRHEISAPIPEDADLIRFGVTLAGPGHVALRNPGLRLAEAGRPQPDTDADAEELTLGG
jgi:hypothetical protein